MSVQRSLRRAALVLVSALTAGLIGVPSALAVASQPASAQGRQPVQVIPSVSVRQAAPPRVAPQATNCRGSVVAIFNLTVCSGDGQTAAVGTSYAHPLSVRLTVLGIVGAPHVPIAFTAPETAPSGVFQKTHTTGQLVTTDAQGVATTSDFVADHLPGTVAVTARLALPRLPPVSSFTNTVTFTLTNTAGPAAAIAVTGGDNQSTQVGATFAHPLAVGVTDRFGNRVPRATVTFSGPGAGAGGSFAPPSATTDASGSAFTSATANDVAGTWTATASVPGLAGADAFHLTNAAGPSAALAPTGGDNQSTQVGTAFGSPLSVKVTDAFGNPVPSALVTFTPNGTGGGNVTGTLSPTLAATDPSGVASTKATANDAAGPWTATASVAGTAGTATFHLTNTPGPVASLSVAGVSSPSTAGTPSNVTVTAEDAFGNIVTGYLGTVHFTSSDGQATLPGDYTFVPGDNGTHTFSGGVTLKTAATQSVTATDTTNASLASTQSPITVVAGPVDHLTLSPNSATIEAGQSVHFTVAAFDAFGNSLDSSSTTFTSSNTGALTCAGSTCTGVGVGIAVMTASDNGVTVTATVKVTSAGLDHISISPASRGLFVGDSVTFTVTAVDTVGNSTDVTGSTSFVSTDTGILTCSGPTCTGVSAGIADVIATYQGITATAPVTVSSVPSGGGGRQPPPPDRCTGLNPPPDCTGGIGKR